MKAIGIAVVLVLIACDRAPVPSSQSAITENTLEVVVEPVAFSAGAGAMAPRWAVGAKDPTLSWVEPRGEAGSVLRVSSLRGEGWTEARDVVASTKFFANWADLPVVAESASGRFAFWPEKLGEGTYDYGVHLASEENDGTWQRRGFVHDDLTPAEYGFASPVVDADGAVRVFWLDGRAMPAGGAMHLASTTVSGAGVGATDVLDDRVCECCTTDAAVAANGPIVVYRDRSEGEIRDIGVVRWLGSGWSTPMTLADDGWKIQGCPVNGPAIDAREQWVAVAWFTAPANQPRVQVSWSTDGGEHFSAPVVVATGTAVLGRVDVVVLGSGGALVSWVESGADQRAEIRGRVVDESRRLSTVATLGSTMVSRQGGFPRLLASDDAVLLASVGPEGTVDVARLALRLE